MTQSDSLKDRDLRQRDLVPPARLAECRVIIVGVGAVGRQVALQLAAMGASNMTLVDHDTVDVVNLAPQGYLPEDLGQPKVTATAEWCRRLNPDLHLHITPERFVRSSIKTLPCFQPSDKKLVLFACVDDIAVRRILWEAVKDRVQFFADARMSSEVLRVLSSASPSDDRQYITTLFTPEQAFVGSCTAKSTIYTASIAAGFMLSQFAKWLRGLPVDPDLLLNLLSSELIVA